MSGKIYRHKSMHVSRSTKPLTNYSWQVWKSIYNNHTDVKIFPTMIWAHKKQATLVNTQSHLYEGTRQNMHVTIYKNADQTFWIFYFLCIFGFLTQKQVKIDQKNNIQSIQKKKTHTHTHTQIWKNMLYK